MCKKQLEVSDDMTPAVCTARNLHGKFTTLEKGVHTTIMP